MFSWILLCLSYHWTVVLDIFSHTFSREVRETEIQELEWPRAVVFNCGYTSETPERFWKIPDMAQLFLWRVWCIESVVRTIHQYFSEASQVILRCSQSWEGLAGLRGSSQVVPALRLVAHGVVRTPLQHNEAQHAMVTKHTGVTISKVNGQSRPPERPVIPCRKHLPRIRFLTSFCSSSFLYSSIPWKSFSFLGMLTGRMGSSMICPGDMFSIWPTSWETKRRRKCFPGRKDEKVPCS